MVLLAKVTDMQTINRMHLVVRINNILTQMQECIDGARRVNDKLTAQAFSDDYDTLHRFMMKMRHSALAYGIHEFTYEDHLLYADEMSLLESYEDPYRQH